MLEKGRHRTTGTDTSPAVIADLDRLLGGQQLGVGKRAGGGVGRVQG